MRQHAPTTSPTPARRSSSTCARRTWSDELVDRRRAPARPAPRPPRAGHRARSCARRRSARRRPAGRGGRQPRHGERRRRHAAARPTAATSTSRAARGRSSGCELPAPVTTRAALAANVTNELGVDGTVRLLKNVTGLWLLEECRRCVGGAGAVGDDAPSSWPRPSAVPGGRSVVDPDDPRFAAPGDLPARIAAACRESGQPVPSSPAEVARVILDSLALRVARHGRAPSRRSAGDRGRASSTWSAAARRSPLLAPAVRQRLRAPGARRARPRRRWSATRIVQAVAAGVLGRVAEGRELVERSLGVDSGQPRADARLGRRSRARLARRPAARPRRRGRDRRRPHDELGMEQHLLVDVGLVGLALGEQQLGGGAAEQLAGLAHRAERHGRRAGELDVVVARRSPARRARRRPCRVICWSRPSARRSLAQNAAVGRRARGSPTSRSPARRPSATLSAAVSSTSERRRPAARGLRAWRAPRRRSADLHGGHRPADEGDPLVALLAQVGHGERRRPRRRRRRRCTSRARRRGRRARRGCPGAAARSSARRVLRRPA